MLRQLMDEFLLAGQANGWSPLTVRQYERHLAWLAGWLEEHGATALEEVTRTVAATILSSLRGSDFAGRFGGEEFLLLLPDTSVDQALRVAEKIRVTVQARAQAEVGHVTISLGVALLDVADADENRAVQRADERLYQAKAAGRNQVVGPPSDVNVSAPSA